MSLYNAPLGAPEPTRAILTTTTATEIVPAGGIKQGVAKIHICNITAAVVAFDLEVHSGATVFYIEKGRPLAANASFDVLDEVLQTGHSLWVKAATANALHVSVIYSAAMR